MDQSEWQELGERLTEAERDVVRLLVRLEQHTLLTKLGGALADVTQVVHEMNAPGEVNAKFAITQTAPHEPMTSIAVKLTKKVPGHKPVGAFTYFFGRAFEERDIRQPEMPQGRTVEREQRIRAIQRPEEVRRVGDD